MIKYIITGTGRCGTLNMAHNFTLAGIPCGHESIFNPEGLQGAKDRLSGKKRIEASQVSMRDESIWFDPLMLKADSSYMAAPFLGEEIIKDAQIIHLVRNPLKVISSFVKNLGYFRNLKNSSWEKFMCRHVPDLLETDDHLERACIYYLKWNEMIEQHDTIFHRIEDDVNVLLKQIGGTTIEPSTELNILFERDRDFTFDDIPLKDEIISISQRYGYD